MSENKNDKSLRIAMLGMIPGNGHPYSWSAIVNGYDPEKMASCPYDTIPVYLGEQPLQEVKIDGASVTHIWTDVLAEAKDVAAASLIPNVVERPEDVIGEVDAVIISTDDGEDHVRRAAPFVAAGLPVFVDKPLAVSVPELRQFRDWRLAGAKILSSSGLRYAPEIEQLRGQNWKWLCNNTIKTLERYGIHALEPMFVLLGPGFQEVTWSGIGNSCVVTASHSSGAMATFAVLPEATAASGVLQGYGEQGHKVARTKSPYLAFRGQLLAAVEWFKTGKDPYPFDHTIELMAILIAARESRAKGGKAVSVASVLEQL